MMRTFEIIHFQTVNDAGKVVLRPPPSPTFVKEKTAYYARERAAIFFHCSAQTIYVHEVRDDLKSIELVEDDEKGVSSVPILAPACETCAPLKEKLEKAEKAPKRRTKRSPR